MFCNNVGWKESDVTTCIVVKAFVLISYISTDPTFLLSLAWTSFLERYVPHNHVCRRYQRQKVLVVYTWLLFERVLMLDFASVEWYLLLVMAVW